MFPPKAPGSPVNKSKDWCQQSPGGLECPLATLATSLLRAPCMVPFKRHNLTGE